MVGAVQNIIRYVDSGIARAYLSLRKERPGLLCFLFHALFRDESEIEQNHVDPLDRTTVAMFRELIAYYVDCGYQFVTPQQVLAGLDPSGRYAMLTFDDGYYNNHLALPVLEAFNVPALFFISTRHVREQKCYWWDVLYRERLAEGASKRQAYYDGVEMKSRRTEEMESELISRYGVNALKPRSDIDRPFKPSELAEFAKHPLVHLGNHTANHAILTNYTPQEALRQVQLAQHHLLEMTGKTPIAIAYPNGNENDEVIRICRQAGLQLGFTIVPQKNLLPLNQYGDLMRLHRFVPHSEGPIRSQCLTYRSDMLLYASFREAYLRLFRRRRAPVQAPMPRTRASMEMA